MPDTDFTFPRAFARIGAKIPHGIAGLPLMAALTVARQQRWLLAPDDFNGRRFRLRVDDLGLEARFTCQGGRFKPLLDSAPVDLDIAASALDLARLALGQEDADTLFFRRRLRIEGDTELGVMVKYWLDATERPRWLQRLASAYERLHQRPS